MTQPKLSCPLTPKASRTPLTPRARLTLWWALLAAYSFQSVLLLTTLALRDAPRLDQQSFALGPILIFPLLFSLSALAVVLATVRRLAWTKHAALVERVLAACCIAFLVANAYATIHLLGGA